MVPFRVSERAGVVVESCLERACESDVGFFFPVVFSHDCCLVNDPFCLAYSGEWTGFFLAAIALFGCSWIAQGFFNKQRLVVRWDNVLHVGRAA